MSEIRNQLSRHRERNEMSDVDWRTYIDTVGTKPFAANSNESRIAVAAERLKVSARQIRRLFYGETDEPKYRLGVAIKTLAEQQADRFEAIAASLEAKNDAMFLEEVSRLRALALRVRRK